MLSQCCVSSFTFNHSLIVSRAQRTKRISFVIFATWFIPRRIDCPFERKFVYGRSYRCKSQNLSIIWSFRENLSIIWFLLLRSIERPFWFVIAIERVWLMDKVPGSMVNATENYSDRCYLRCYVQLLGKKIIMEQQASLSVFYFAKSFFV